MTDLCEVKNVNILCTITVADHVYVYSKLEKWPLYSKLLAEHRIANRLYWLALDLGLACNGFATVIPTLTIDCHGFHKGKAGCLDPFHLGEAPHCSHQQLVGFLKKNVVVLLCRA